MINHWHLEMAGKCELQKACVEEQFPPPPGLPTPFPGLFSTLLVLLKWALGLWKSRLWLCFEHIKLGSQKGLYHSQLPAASVKLKVWPVLFFAVDLFLLLYTVSTQKVFVWTCL